MNRRGFLTGIIAACVAPAIIRTSGLIMPIKPALVEATVGEIGFIENIRFVEWRRPHEFVAIVHPIQERWLRDYGQFKGRYALSQMLPQFEEKMMS